MLIKISTFKTPPEGANGAAGSPLCIQGACVSGGLVCALSSPDVFIKDSPWGPTGDKYFYFDSRAKPISDSLYVV